MDTRFKKGISSNNVNRLLATPREDAHYKWSDKPSYSAVHTWINKVLGKPLECENCGFQSDNNRQFHWANLSGQYLRDITDWARLCVVCHFAIDNITNRGWQTKRSKQCV